MITQKRVKSLKISINEAALRRLPPNHPKKAKITQDLAMWRAGQRGEEEVDYYLSLFPEKEFHIFQGIRLQHQEKTFQIDNLLLSPHLFLPLEVKNFLGTVTFNPQFRQVIREFNGREDGFEDPIIQAKRHQYQLRQWMSAHKLPPIPINFLVAFGKSTTILKNPTHSPEVYNKVCFAGNLFFRINELMARYPKEVLTSKEMRKCANTLLKNYLPEKPNYSIYQIPQNEFITGVQCPCCNIFRMYRVIGFWKCPACGFLSKDAHIQAIQDYFLLINDFITTRELQRFLHLPNYNVASKILIKMDLIPTGFRRDRRYSPRSFYFP